MSFHFLLLLFPLLIIATVGHQSATNKTASRYILSSIVSWVSLRLWLLGPHMIQLYVWRREYSQCFSHVYLSVQLKSEQNSDNALYTQPSSECTPFLFYPLAARCRVSRGDKWQGEREARELTLFSLCRVCVYMCAQVLLIGAKRLSIIDFSHQQGSGKQAACSILFTNKKKKRKKVLFRFPGP